MNDTDSRAESTTIRLAEYQALRAEILNRFDSQRQLLSLAIIATGTLFGASVLNKDPKVGTILILGYPLLGMFLGAGWGHHDRRITQIGAYISQHIECPTCNGARGGVCPRCRGTRVEPGYP